MSAMTYDTNNIGPVLPKQDVAAGSVFRVFGCLVMGPSWIWIFMKINMFLFEGLKIEDFLDPDFSDTCMWVQDPHENEWNYGYPHFEGSWTHIYLSKKSGSKKSWLFKSPKRNIFIFIKIHIQEGPIKMDPKPPKNHGYPHFEGSWTHIHVSEKYGSKKSWRFKSSNRNIFIFIKIHIQEGPVTRDPKTPKTHPAARLCCGWEERAICLNWLCG